VCDLARDVGDGAEREGGGGLGARVPREGGSYASLRVEREGVAGGGGGGIGSYGDDVFWLGLPCRVVEPASLWQIRREGV
jgi:hypothetical protein